MAQIREIRKRIRSIENTKKVTHAMELVAAAKMKKTQMQTLASRPYSLALNEVLAQTKLKTEESTHPLLASGKKGKEITILITSDRGLAGGLNINLFREILRSEAKNIAFIAVGKKATNFITKTGGELLASYQSEEKEPLDLARTLAKMSADAYLFSQTSKVNILYPHFESTMKQTPTWIQLLPIELENNTQTTGLLFEPSADEVIEELLPHYVLTRLYQVLLETKASEYSARMVAMKNATDAAGDLVFDLTLTYNQARQEAITKELLDITTAQKAFE